MPVAAISFAIETYCGGGGAGITDQSGGSLLTDATVYSGAAALHHEQHQGGWVRPGVGEGVVGAPGQQGLLWAMNVQIIKVKGFDNLVGLSRHSNLLWWGGRGGDHI